VRIDTNIVGSYNFADIDPNARAGFEIGIYVSM
jgi:hypothetical protein